MTSTLKACLRKNPDESASLLRNTMDDGNSKKILSVSIEKLMCCYGKGNFRQLYVNTQTHVLRASTNEQLHAHVLYRRVAAY